MEENMTLADFKKYCLNSKEIIEKYNIQNDDDLKNFGETYVGYGLYTSHYFKLVYFERTQKYESIDEQLATLIDKLNNKWLIPTVYCCWGHKLGESAYVVFEKDTPGIKVFIDKVIQKMWKLDYYVMYEDWWGGPTLRWKNKGCNHMMKNRARTKLDIAFEEAYNDIFEK